MDNNDLKQWIELSEKRFSDRWKLKKLSVDKKHSYILNNEIWKENLYPIIKEFVDNLRIKFHSPHNPKSSQILALNLFLPLKYFKSGFLNSFFQQNQKIPPEITFEWSDPDNLLKQQGTKSQHDVLVDFGLTKYLIEVKYIEHTDQPCGTSLKNKECKKPLSEIQCPLSNQYGTRYYKVLHSGESPYDINENEGFLINVLFSWGISIR